MSTLSSSSSSSICPWKYHIFLSFSGKETRKSFTDHLYAALNRNGIITFRDDNNLRRGEDIALELLKAIGESWGSIIVFSEGYAFSSWCLDELTEIVKQRKERGHQVYAIFYDVEVSDLRYQRKRVQEAFDMHEERWKENKEKTQRWRDALSQVANISGWPLKDQYESNFIEDIVKDISTKLSQTYSQVKELYSKLNIRQGDVRIIGVCGTGGIGKTTLARIVYTQMSTHFEAKSFLADVGEVSRKKGLVSLQKQFLSQILQEENDIISQRLPHKKVLMVIDGADDMQQLKCLVGRRERFDIGSRIIVTTEDEHLLQSFGVDDLYKLTTLDARRTINEFGDTANRKRDRIKALKEDTKSRMSAKLQHPRKKPNKEARLRLKNVDDDGRIGQKLSTTTLVGDAAKICKEKIWAYLMDDGVSNIGVWGMAGVGKTAIMKQVNNQLLEETEKFNNVIWITVSKEVNIFRLQDKIADAMNVTLPKVKDEAIRAGIINDMLSQKGKYVLVLDDLWDTLSLEEVGIPEPSNGSKLVVTTWSLDVCHYLGCLEVRVPALSKSEAWRLFLEKVGQDVLNHPDLLPIVESVAEECDGLPLAIVTIASNMKRVRNIHEWRNALYELNRHVESVSGIEGKVFQQLQFSYDRLHNEKLKHCFLCCALYPEDHDIFIYELIDLWVAEGLVEEMDSMEVEDDKGHAILNKLKKNCLIESGTRYPHHSVKLHDIVRDMALRITSARPQFLVRAGLQLKEIPNVQEWNEDLEKVSLMLNWELEIPSKMPPPRCQKLTTLLLSNCLIKSIPECFFEQMHGLQILDLSNNLITNLPNSISNLEVLTTLLLGDCEYLRKVPSFSKLQALKKLVLRETKIKDLPHGLERLVNLKYLDLIGTSITEVADGILANFTSLKHLAMLNFYEEVDRFVRGKEIGGLRKLEFFEGGFYDLNEWNNYIQALHAPTEGPCQYYISVGGRPQFHLQTKKKKVIELSSCNICSDGIKVLPDVNGLGIWKCIVDLCEEEAFSSRFILPAHNVFSSLSDIRIISCQNIKKLFSSNWVLQNLQNLKFLFVRDCGDMEEIIAAESESEEEGRRAINFTLPKLRTLELSRLPELKSICSANGVMDFYSIEEINIKNCPKLKRIPLNISAHDFVHPFPPHSLSSIQIVPEEQWELFEWDKPIAKHLLQRYIRHEPQVTRFSLARPRHSYMLISCLALPVLPEILSRQGLFGSSRQQLTL